MGFDPRTRVYRRVEGDPRQDVTIAVLPLERPRQAALAMDPPSIARTLGVYLHSTYATERSQAHLRFMESTLPLQRFAALPGAPPPAIE